MKLQQRISQWSDLYVARRIAMEVLGMTKEELVIGEMSEIGEIEKEKVDAMAREYFEDERPLAYVLGYEIFCEQRFLVNERVLIPRAETEELVKLVGEKLSKIVKNSQKVVLLDMGTGSGCVGLSIMKHWAQKVHKEQKVQQMQWVLCDVSEEVLEVAKINSQTVVKKSSKSRQRLVMKQVDVMRLVDDDQGLIQYIDVADEVVIVANLPYIPEGYDGVDDDVARREPGLALFSGEDGLAHYRALIEWVQEVHREQKDQKKWNVWMEMMREQGEMIMKDCEGLGKMIEMHETFHENIVILEMSLKC